MKLSSRFSFYAFLPSFDDENPDIRVDDVESGAESEHSAHDNDIEQSVFDSDNETWLKESNKETFLRRDKKTQ